MGKHPILTRHNFFKVLTGLQGEKRKGWLIFLYSNICMSKKYCKTRKKKNTQQLRGLKDPPLIHRNTQRLVRAHLHHHPVLPSDWSGSTRVGGRADTPTGRWRNRGIGLQQDTSATAGGKHADGTRLIVTMTEQSVNQQAPQEDVRRSNRGAAKHLERDYQ